MITEAEFNEFYKKQRGEDNYYADPADILSGYTWNFEKKTREKVEYEIGNLEVVEDFGGEGQGDHRHVVIAVNGEQYFMIEGYYSSYDGTDWEGNDFFEVEPVEKMIIEFEKKKVDSE